MFYLEFVFAKTSKHLGKVCLMFICPLTVHEYIFQVYQRKFVDIVTQYAICESLESDWGVTQAQWKHIILVQSVMCYKRSFWSSARSQSNLVVTTGQVDCQ